MALIINTLALFLFVTVSAVSALNCSTTLFPDLTNCVALSPQYVLYWSIAADNSTITFGAEVAADASSSWIGLGLSERGGMRTGDEWIIRQAANGTYFVQDSYTDDYGFPYPDAQQDVRLVQGPVYQNGSTTFKVSRALQSCDSMDLSVQFDTMHAIIWAYGSQSNGNIQQHCPQCRGTSYITLWKNPAAVSAVIPADTQPFSVLIPSFTIPSEKTSYYCINVQAPNDTKYHIIGYEGVVTTPYVHHMIIFTCETQPPEEFNTPYPCFSMTSQCTFTLGWAPGVQKQYFPAQAGFPIGVGVNANQYLVLQMHYNNPTNAAGVVDNSGINMYYTKQLRQYDSGILIVGNRQISIPGDKPDYTVLAPNQCASSCTSQFNTTLNLISSSTHMHLLGHNQTVRQIRNGVELEPLLVRRNYDFGFQGSERLHNRTIQPGDQLITTCGYYPTLGVRNVTTKYGESTDDEMCYNFISYYPKVDFDYCFNIDAANQNICTSSHKLRTLLNGEPLSSPNFTTPQGSVYLVQTLIKGGSMVPSVPLANVTFRPFSPDVCVPSDKSTTTPTTVSADNSTTSKPSAGESFSKKGRCFSISVLGSLPALVLIIVLF